ncbi:MAG: 3'-5' exonuclease [Bacteroidota bacterium]
MIEQIDLSKILFLDIETVSEQNRYEDLSERFQKLWKLKSRSVLRQYDEEITDEQAAAAYTDKAGIFAEFGKIVCISVGVMYRSSDGRFGLRLKSFASEDESELLRDFSQMLNQYYNDSNQHYICGHNIKEFDVPYMCRRIITNQLHLPNLLQIAGKKPWETKYLLDTLELWKFGDYKHYTSLNLLAAVLDFPTPKDDIDGSQVGRVFWEEGDIDRIAFYCEKDVLATVQLFLRYKRLPILEDDQVTFVDQRA